MKVIHVMKLVNFRKILNDSRVDVFENCDPSDSDSELSDNKLDAGGWMKLQDTVKTSL